MRKIFIYIAFIFTGSSFVFSQVVTNEIPVVVNQTNSFLDASENAENFGPSIGRGLNFPKTDLTVFELDVNALDGIQFPNFYDGLIVYNTAKNGSTNDPSLTTQTTNLSPGFYYFYNPDGYDNYSIEDGQWIKLSDVNPDVNSNFWTLDGNGGTTEVTLRGANTDGVDENTITAGNFIGTTDAKSLTIGTNNIARLNIGAIPETVGDTDFDFVMRVYGKAKFDEGLVTSNSTYPDYVFDNYFTGKSEVNPNYNFKSLNEVEAFIKENNHLPGVTSIDELNKVDGAYEVDNAALAIQTLEKVEELYLHVIEQEKEIKALKAELAELKK